VQGEVGGVFGVKEGNKSLVVFAAAFVIEVKRYCTLRPFSTTQQCLARRRSIVIAPVSPAHPATEWRRRVSWAVQAARGVVNLPSVGAVRIVLDPGGQSLRPLSTRAEDVAA
jgi:hypothetical protein